MKSNDKQTSEMEEGYSGFKDCSIHFFVAFRMNSVGGEDRRADLTHTSYMEYL